MKTRAQARSRRLLAAALPLLLAPVPALLAQSAPVLATPEDVRVLLRDAQAAALPSASVVTQDVGAVSVAPATTNAAAWFSAVGSGPALAFEDPATDETVVTNPATGGAARLAPEPDYDPDWAFLAAGYNVETNADLLPFYDPSLVVLSLSLAINGEESPAADDADGDEDSTGTVDGDADGASADTLSSEEPTAPRSAPSEAFPGYAPGLLASYYEFAVAPSVVPDFTGPAPDFEQVEDTLDHPDASSWPGVAMSARHRFAARYVLDLFAPATADYEFRLQSDDGSVLSVDGVLLIDNDGVHGRRLRSGTVYLTHGFHRIEVGYFDEGWRCGLQLFWSGSSFRTIPTNNVWHLVGDPDGDDDGAPDWWEALYGFDPEDASDAALDPDSDGLSNLAEFLAGTNPLLADTDGDGMPDDWEVGHGLRPCDASDVGSDPDGDGLANLAELRAGTDPNDPDTDGDGESDGLEVLTVFSDPLSVDFDGTAVSVADFGGGAASAPTGLWLREGDRLDLQERCGSLAYSFELATAGVCRVRASFSCRGTGTAALACSVDGLVVGVVPLASFHEAGDSRIDFYTPHLASGAHAVVLEVCNPAPGIRFALDGISVSRPGGPDADENGRPDWLDARFARFALARTGAISSKVSPFCLRGTAAFVDRVSVSTGGTVRGLPGGGWWTDVPLSPDSPVAVSASFENGAKTDSATISWVPFDLCAESSASVRAEDSLLLCAAPAGADSVEISVSGPGTNAIWTASSGSPVPFRFSTAGQYAVSASWMEDGTTNGVSLAVTAVAGSLWDSIPLWSGRANVLNLPRVPASGARLLLDAGLSPSSVKPQASGGWKATLQPPDSTAFGPSGWASLELDGGDGAVLASAPLLFYRPIWSAGDFYYEAETLPDGTRVCVNGVWCGDLPADVEMECWVWQAGVCFEDGSVCKRFRKSDLDANGVFRYRFLAPEDLDHPCQYLRAFFGGIKIVD